MEKRNKSASILSLRQEFTFSFDDLTYSVVQGPDDLGNLFKREKKDILKNVSGSFKSGTLTGIIGESGSGKTTLLNSLAGFVMNFQSGVITLNGKQVKPADLRRQSICSHIASGDHLHEGLTAEELIDFAVRFRSCGNLDDFQRMELVLSFLSYFKLDKCKDVQTRYLSTGERKRVVLATELISNPPIILLDEPTTSLDSKSAFECISLLRQIADDGHLVVCVMHQPSSRSLRLLDQLILLRDGEILFHDSPKRLEKLVAYNELIQDALFMNPADMVLDAIAKPQENSDPSKNPDPNADTSSVEFKRDNNANTAVCLNGYEINKHGLDPSSVAFENAIDASKPLFGRNEFRLCLSSAASASASASAGQRRSFPFVYHFTLHLKRMCLLFRRESAFFGITALAYTLIGILVGIQGYQRGDDGAHSFSIVGLSCLIGGSASSMTQGISAYKGSADLKVITREHANGWYSLNTYFWAKTLVDFTYLLILIVLLMLPCYFLIGLPLEANRIFLFYIGNAIGCLSTQAMTMAAVNLLGVTKGFIVSLALLTFNVVFSGSLIAPSAMPGIIRWVIRISIVRYSFVITILGIFAFNRPLLGCSTEFCISVFRQPEKLLGLIEIANETVWKNICITLLLAVFYRTVFYGSLCYKFNRP